MLANRIKRVTVRNYRSLGDVTVELDDLTVLVGPNGSGKSNFVDALRFVSQALQQGLALALNARGGIPRVRRHSPEGDIHDVSIKIEAELNGEDGLYEFVLSSTLRSQYNEYWLKSETCSLGQHGYEIQNGVLVKSTIGQGIPIQEKNLTLPLLGDVPESAPLYAFLTQMRFYSIFPDSLRAPQHPGSSYPLDEAGGNLATMLSRIAENPWRDDFYRSLARIVPGISPDNPFTVPQVGSYLVIDIRHEDGSLFDLALESDGTLRVLGLLAAVYQAPALPLVGIEEPELFVHPHALAVLNDVLDETAHRSQVILTTHSPDLISRFPAASLRVVEQAQGVTNIGRVRPDQVDIINEQLFKGGDLLRIGGLARE